MNSTSLFTLQYLYLSRYSAKLKLSKKVFNFFEIKVKQMKSDFVHVPTILYLLSTDVNVYNILLKESLVLFYAAFIHLFNFFLTSKLFLSYEKLIPFQ